MTRYEAAKRRQRCKDKQETGNDLLSENKSVAVQTVIMSHSVEDQTDFTMVDLAALEHDCQTRASGRADTITVQIQGMVQVQGRVNNSFSGLSSGAY